MRDAHSSPVQAYQGVYPQLAEGVYIHLTAAVIGDVVLADDVSVWPGTVIRGDINSIRIGAGTNVQDLSVLHVSHKSSWDQAAAPLIIGSNVTIGHNVILHGCTIEYECLIVMDKVVVQRRVMLFINPNGFMNCGVQ